MSNISSETQTPPSFKKTLIFIILTVFGFGMVPWAIARASNLMFVYALIGVVLTNVGFWGAIVQASKHLKWIFRDRKHSLWIRAPLLGLFVVLYMFSLSYFVSQLVMPHKSRGIATKPECSSNLDEVKASAGKLYANEAIVEINDIVPSSYDDSPQGDVLCKGVVVTSTAKHKVDIYWSYNNGYRVLVTEATH